LFDSFVNIGGFVVRKEYSLTWAEVPEKKAVPVKTVLEENPCEDGPIEGPRCEGGI
jgi:hypothetical protein